jgi:hypothetical protein
MLLAVVDDFDCNVLAPRAFKRAPIVTGFVRFNAGEPHVCVTPIAARMRDHPTFRKYLIRSHATQPFSNSILQPWWALAFKNYKGR